MREIKFRAWNGKKMLTEDDFFIRYGHCYEYTMFDEPKQTDNTLLQYTGLKDKNGVEIYEGDIIQAWGWNMEIKFFVDGWFAESKDGKCGEVGSELDNECEVIGNIYENPELLGE